MSAAVETWIVVADGEGARVFEERVKLGALTERTDLASLSHENRHASVAHQGTVTDRHGHGRHTAGDNDPATRAEHRFLTALAHDIDTAAAGHAFQHLVIMAPPNALGALRSSLKPATARLIEACDPHERRRENAESVRKHLHNLRSKA